ncbi:hypothetical protein [Actinoplanes sp. NPDC026619]|uniref:hypothetical protein n=1 Tax=Actinoplanes sp. NPDC026619 TaxID=3155798 RepID=UPI003406F661
MTSNKPPIPPPRVVAAELVFLWRIVTCFRAITHGSSHRPGEKLKLLVSHVYIFPRPAYRPLIYDHANLGNPSSAETEIARPIKTIACRVRQNGR